jgi:hypothetical protein
MPSLGDYLGTLLSEITKARLQADLESARIAQLYAAHPLLQHFAVPRFRLPNVALDLPVAVEATDESAAKPPSTDEIHALRRKIDVILEKELEQRKLSLIPSVRSRLTKNLNLAFDRLQSADKQSASDAMKTSDEAVIATMEAIRAASEDQSATDPAVESSLRRQFAAEFVALQPPPPQVQVLVATAQLKDVAPPQVLTRVQLTISEEGVEWTQTNPEDSSSKTLLPE